MKYIRFLCALITVCSFVTSALAQTVTILNATPFSASGDLAVDTDGNIFVADFGTFLNTANGAEVYRVTPEGVVSCLLTVFPGLRATPLTAKVISTKPISQGTR
jgi:hypothetical protein